MTDNRLIAFLAEGLRCAFPIGDVVEVISAWPVEAVYGGKDPLEGLMIYREKGVLPVFSLALIFGRPRGEMGKLVMVIRSGGGQLGFRIDRILGLIDAPRDGRYEPAEDEPEATRSRLKGLLPYKGGRLLVLDSARTFRFDAS